MIRTVLYGVWRERRLIVLGLSPVTLVLAWMSLASAWWSYGTGKHWSVFGWWYATVHWQENWWAKFWLASGALFASLVIATSCICFWQGWRRRRRVNRRLRDERSRSRAAFFLPNPLYQPPAPKLLPSRMAVSDNHGHSHFRSAEDIRKRFDGPVFPHGGIVVGENCRLDLDLSIVNVEFDPRDESTWGMGGKADLIIDSCTKGARAWHSGVFGPTGSGKSSELTTRALVWTASSVIFDPTIELGPRLDKAMRRQGKRVYHIGLPYQSKEVRQAGFNVLLASVDPSHPEAEGHLRSLSSRIYDEASAEAAMRGIGKADDPFFGEMGRNLVTCILAHLTWSDPDKVEISLATFAKGMALPEMDMIAALHGIYATSPSRMARQLAGGFMDARAAETFSGIYLNAIKGVQWLFTRAYADLLSIGEFDPRLLLLGDCTAFINIHYLTIHAAPLIPRVLVGAIVDTILRAHGRALSLIALFVDEADVFKTLDAFAKIRDLGRHSGIVFHGLWQSTDQLRQTWGEAGYRAWRSSFSWVGFCGIQADGLGRELSPALGGTGVLAYSEGNNQGQQMPWGLSFGSFSAGENVNVHEIAKPLMSAPQLQQDMRSDEMIVVPDIGMPMRVSRALHFRRNEIMAQLEAA